MCCRFLYYFTEWKICSFQDWLICLITFNFHSSFFFYCLINLMDHPGCMYVYVHEPTIDILFFFIDMCLLASFFSIDSSCWLQMLLKKMSAFFSICFSIEIISVRIYTAQSGVFWGNDRICFKSIFWYLSNFCINVFPGSIIYNPYKGTTINLKRGGYGFFQKKYSDFGGGKKIIWFRVFVI